MITSTIYDAFVGAGIMSVPEKFKNPVLAKDVFEFLRENGWTVFLKGSYVNIPDNEGFLLFKTPDGSGYSYIEYHRNTELDKITYSSDEVCAIALKL